MMLLPAAGFAQGARMIRGYCTPHADDDGVAGARVGQQPRRLPAINRHWDADKVYRQLVILISFSDLDFALEKPREVYDSIFNEPGYNKRNGAGCVADYFRCQSGGLLNMKFDVFGPYKVSSKAQPYDSPTESTHNYGASQMVEATKTFIAENPGTDFSLYDWNGDGAVNQVVFVCAGFCGNQSSEKCYGYVWPNTSSFSTITTPDGKKISNYTASCELWANNSSCGIGTVCHEFTHSLGLPDIYPTNDNAGFSVVDEWDLMDGGNFTNYGWCPPNYSALEKMLMGWLAPVELTEPAHIEGMKAVADGGDVYIVRNTTNEYYLLENRQQKDWDLGIPGSGLAVFHVNYNAAKWSGNTVNTSRNAYCYDMVHADNMDYDAWYDMLVAENATTPYANKPRLNSRLLSTSPYPWKTDSTRTVNAELTDTSVPAAVMLNANAEGHLLMSKPITNITQNPDGTIAFDFMGGSNDGISTLAHAAGTMPRLFDMLGRAAGKGQAPRLLIVRLPDGTTRKVMK